MSGSKRDAAANAAEVRVAARGDEKDERDDSSSVASGDDAGGGVIDLVDGVDGNVDKENANVSSPVNMPKKRGRPSGSRVGVTAKMGGKKRKSGGVLVKPDRPPKATLPTKVKLWNEQENRGPWKQKSTSGTQNTKNKELCEKYQPQLKRVQDSYSALHKDHSGAVSKYEQYADDMEAYTAHLKAEFESKAQDNAQQIGELKDKLNKAQREIDKLTIENKSQKDTTTAKIDMFNDRLRDKDVLIKTLMEDMSNRRTVQTTQAKANIAIGAARTKKTNEIALKTKAKQDQDQAAQNNHQMVRSLHTNAGAVHQQHQNSGTVHHQHQNQQYDFMHGGDDMTYVPPTYQLGHPNPHSNGSVHGSVYQGSYGSQYGDEGSHYLGGSVHNGGGRNHHGDGGGSVRSRQQNVQRGGVPSNIRVSRGDSNHRSRGGSSSRRSSAGSNQQRSSSGAGGGNRRGSSRPEQRGNDGSSSASSTVADNVMAMLLNR